MKNNYRRYAPIGLVISLLAVLTGLGVLVAKGLAFAGLYLPAKPELLNQIGVGAIAGLVLGLAIFAIIDPDRARAFLTGRQAQYGSNSIIMLLAFIGIVVVVNVITYQNPKKWDVTEDKSNTLATESVNTLQSLSETVTATAFYSTNLNRTSASQLLDKFKTSSNGKFQYSFINPDENPVAAQQAGITSDGEIVLTMGTRHETISIASEQELTSGLIRLMNPQEAAIYFITGNGERDINTSGNNGFTQVRTALEGRNYVVKPLNLQAENAIPSDAKVIVVAGPLKPLAESDVNLLDGFLSNGGSLVVMEDPSPATQFGDSADPLAALLANKWGITLNNDLVLNPNSPSNPLYAVADQYDQSHPITARMNNVVAIFPIARSLTLNTEANPAVQPVALVKTVDQAWGERDFQSINNNQPSFDAQNDTPGPLTIVAAAEDSTTKARLVVFGNSSFALDANFSAYGNSDFLTNSMDWAAGEENLINLSSKQAISRTFNPPGSLQLIGMVVLIICILPLLVIGAGLASWLSRRRRG